METMFKSFFAMFEMLFMTVLNGTRGVNNLALSFKNRTDIMTETSAQKACLGYLHGRHSFAKELQAIKDSGMDPTVLKAGDDFIAAFKAGDTLKLP